MSLGDLLVVVAYTSPEIISIDEISTAEGMLTEDLISAQILVNDDNFVKKCLLIIIINKIPDRSILDHAKTSSGILNLKYNGELKMEEFRKETIIVLSNLIVDFFLIDRFNLEKLFVLLEKIDIKFEDGIHLDCVGGQHGSRDFIFNGDFFPKSAFIKNGKHIKPLHIENMQRTKKDINGDYVYRINYKENNLVLSEEKSIWFITRRSLYYIVLTTTNV